MKTKQKIFFAKILFKIINFFFPKKININRNGINWSLDISEAIDLHILIFGNFEKEIVNIAKKIKLNKYKIIIDIGANIGVHSLQFARAFENSKIFAIEATDYAYNKFLNNLRFNKSLSKNIQTFYSFLGSNNQDKPVSIFSSWSLETQSKTHPKHYGEKKTTQGAKILTLDQFVIQNDIKNVDFIKLDVDGYEYDVLLGGKNFLKKTKPPIFMEFAPYLYKEYGYSENQILDLIISLDYDFYDLNKLTKINDIEKELKKMKDGASKNILLK